MRWFVLVLALSALVGCRRPLGIVGTWDGTTSVGQFTGDCRMTFRDNGTYTCTLVFKLRSTVTQTATGTWRLDEPDRLWTHVDDISLASSSTSEGTQRLAAKFQQRKPQILIDANRDPITVLSWHGPNFYSYKDQSGDERFFHRLD